jgi:hypothetical protein
LKTTVFYRCLPATLLLFLLASCRPGGFLSRKYTNGRYIATKRTISVPSANRQEQAKIPAPRSGKETAGSGVRSRVIDTATVAEKDTPISSNEQAISAPVEKSARQWEKKNELHTGFSKEKKQSPAFTGRSRMQKEEETDLLSRLMDISMLTAIGLLILVAVIEIKKTVLGLSVVASTNLLIVLVTLTLVLMLTYLVLKVWKWMNGGYN